MALLQDYNKYYPILVNDEKAVNILKDSAEKILGKENCENLEKPVMGGEDFSYFGYKLRFIFYKIFNNFIVRHICNFKFIACFGNLCSNLHY